MNKQIISKPTAVTHKPIPITHKPSIIIRTKNLMKTFNPQPKEIPKTIFIPKVSEVVIKAKQKMSSDLYKLIEKRNQDIIKYILEMKYMRKDQIKTKFFSFAVEKSETFTTSAVIKLKDLKYIHENSKGLLMVTGEGEKYLSKIAEGKLLPSVVKRVFEPEVNHDLKLIDLRIRIEELGMVERWYSENMLKTLPFMMREFKDMPDALMIKKDGRGVFLELEISRKTNQRYMDRIEEYKRVLQASAIKDQKIEGVMFLCTDEKVKEILDSATIDFKQLFSVRMLSQYIKENSK